MQKKENHRPCSGNKRGARIDEEITMSKWYQVERDGT
jgi:hypothetical protein